MQRIRMISRAYVPDKTPLLATACAYIDTVEAFGRTRFSIELKNALRQATGRNVWDEPMLNDRGDIIGWVLFVNQPTIQAVHILDAAFTDKMSMMAVHVAIDIDTNDRNRVIALLTQHTILRRTRRTIEPVQFESSHYAVNKALLRRPPAKDAVFYADREGKLDGECDKPHFEVRLERRRAVKAAGINRPIDLLKIKPREFFARQIVTKDHAERLIKETIRTTPNPHVAIEPRVRAILRRSGNGTLADYRRHYPRQFERLTELEWLEIDEKLHWVPAVGRERVGAVVGIVTRERLDPSHQTDDIKPKRHRERLTG